MTVVCMFRDGRGNRRGRGAEVFTLCLCTGTPPTAIYTLSLHDALPISQRVLQAPVLRVRGGRRGLRETGHRLHGRRHHRLLDRKSTRLNSSHANISYAVFCLKKKNTTN